MKKKLLGKLVNTKTFQRWHNKYTQKANITEDLTKEEEQSFKFYANCAEDVVIKYVLDLYCNKTFSEYTYIDIGVNNPTLYDNTFLFYELGGRGILVEPNPAMCKLAEEKRPRDTVICAGVSFDEKIKSAPFYLFESSYEGWSGFDEKRVEMAKKVGVNLATKFNQKLIPINKIFEQYFPDEPPIIVSIDVEGFEEDILNTIDFNKHRPVIYCLESDQTNFEAYAEHPIVNIMAKNGYLYMANTSINMIFLEKSYFNMDKFFWA